MELSSIRNYSSGGYDMCTMAAVFGVKKEIPVSQKRRRKSMNRNYRIAMVVAGLVLTLGGTPSWGQVPSTNDTSDTSGNTGGGSGALVHNTGTNNTAYGDSALSSNTTGHENTAFGNGALMSNTTGRRNSRSRGSHQQENRHKSSRACSLVIYRFQALRRPFQGPAR